MKRSQRAAKPVRAKPETKPAWPPERHSGEGSASVLETLQRLEVRRRSVPQPADDADKK